MKTVGPKLKVIYNSRGYSQQQVADHCGISRISVHRFFNGTTELKVSDFIKMLTLLDIDLNGKIQWLLQQEFGSNQNVGWFNKNKR